MLILFINTFGVVASVLQFVDDPGFNQGNHADYEEGIPIWQDEEEEQENPGYPAPLVFNLNDPCDPLRRLGPAGLVKNVPDLHE